MADQAYVDTEVERGSSTCVLHRSGSTAPVLLSGKVGYRVYAHTIFDTSDILLIIRDYPTDLLRYVVSKLGLGLSTERTGRK